MEKSWIKPFRDPAHEKMGVMCRARVIKKAGKEGAVVEEKH